MRDYLGEPMPGVRAVSDSVRLLGLIVARRDRIALLLGEPARWRSVPGCTFVPLELPGGELAEDEALTVALDRIARIQLGCAATPRASQHTYGATPAHAVDRLAPRAEETPPPLLRLERWRPSDADVGVPPLRRVVIAAYRATLAGEPVAGGGSAGLLWLSLAALRSIVRGLPLGALLEQTGDGARLAPGIIWPENALVYLPAEYGERFLPRVAAKYGPQALFEGEDEGGDDGTGI